MRGPRWLPGFAGGGSAPVLDVVEAQSVVLRELLSIGEVGIALCYAFDASYEDLVSLLAIYFVTGSEIQPPIEVGYQKVQAG